MNKLNYCPFCHKTVAELHGFTGHYFITCHYCGIETRVFKTPDDAFQFWNNCYTHAKDNYYRGRTGNEITRVFYDEIRREIHDQRREVKNLRAKEARDCSDGEKQC